MFRLLRYFTITGSIHLSNSSHHTWRCFKYTSKCVVSQAKLIDNKLENIPSATVSIGAAESYPGSLYMEVLKLADETLYKAKEYRYTREAT